MAEQTPAQPAPATPAPQKPEPPHRDKSGALTLHGMRAKHAAGYSVIHNGNIIPPGQPLPSEADLASATGDASELDRVRKENDDRIKALQDENARLREQAKNVQRQAAPNPAPVPPAK